MADNKTVPTRASVEAFLNGVENATRRQDGRALIALMTRVTGEPPVMWGTSIVGFGSYTYAYESGRTGTMCKTGFSPRKASLVLYIMPGFKIYDELLSRLGKHKTGASCLYINKLADVDMSVLEELVAQGYRAMTAKYG